MVRLALCLLLAADAWPVLARADVAVPLPPAAAPSAPASGASPLQRREVERLQAAFFTALAARDAAALAHLVEYPFRIAAPRTGCATQVADGPQLAAWLDCVFREEPLLFVGLASAVLEPPRLPPPPYRDAFAYGHGRLLHEQPGQPARALLGRVARDAVVDDTGLVGDGYVYDLALVMRRLPGGEGGRVSTLAFTSSAFAYE